MLYADKLASSGLTVDDGIRLGFSQEPPPELDVRGTGFVIPYMDIHGRPTGMFRFRFLTYDGFMAGAANPPRYLQPPGTPPALYIPPLLSWPAFNTSTMPLIITEGELKAACLAVRGYHALGLGGVWSFQHKARGLKLLPEFDEFVLKDRDVYIMFDSDAVSNPQVIKAENRLANRLVERGANVHICRIPGGKDGKVGVDDYVVSGGVLDTLLDNASEYGRSKTLHALNEEVSYVADPGIIVKLSNGLFMTVSSFVNHAFANRMMIVDQVVKQGKEVVTLPKELSAAPAWIRWPHRNEVPGVVYQPGGEQLADGRLNVWTGWGTTPNDGEVTYWNELLDHVFGGSTPARKWFERWLAYPIQHPGAKLKTAALVWSVVTGVGKTAIGYSMGRIYGLNFVEIQHNDFTTQFNQWAKHRQFVMGDEISGGEKKEFTNALKSLITRESVTINEKHIPTYSIRDTINYYFTSNHPDAMALEQDDRRLFVHEVVAERLDPDWATGYFKWLDGGGAGALMNHLLTLDLGDFNPHAPAFETAAKVAMQDLGQGELGSVVKRMTLDPEAFFGKPISVVSTVEILGQIRLTDGPTRITPTGIARELARQRVPKLNEGRQIRVGQMTCVLYALDPAHLSLTPKEIAEVYRREHFNPAGVVCLPEKDTVTSN